MKFHIQLAVLNVSQRLNKILYRYILVIVLVILDQISKIYVKNVFDYGIPYNFIGSYIRITYVENPGLAFGIPVGSFYLVITLITLVITIVILVNLYYEKIRALMFSLSFILGGAIGNIIDRILVLLEFNYNGVVDFIDIGYLDFRWYIFNFADIYITIGILVYILYSYLDNKLEIDKREN